MVTKKLYDDVRKRLKKYRKRYDHEVRNVFDNLGTLEASIEFGSKSEQLKSLPFVHSKYKHGLLSIDQSGPGKGAKMKALRLYVYYDDDNTVLHVLIIGDKSTQEKDVSICENTVSKLINHPASDTKTG